MKKRLSIFLTAALLTFTFLMTRVFADLAPDPEPVEGAATVILYAVGVAVVLIASIIIIKRLGKRNSRK